MTIKIHQRVSGLLFLPLYLRRWKLFQSVSIISNTISAVISYVTYNGAKSGCWKSKSQFAVLLCLFLFIATVLIPPGRISLRLVWIFSYLNTYTGKSKWNGFASCRVSPCLQKGIFFLWYLILSFGKVNNKILLQIWLGPETLFKWQKINTITKSIKQFFTLQLCSL